MTLWNADEDAVGGSGSWRVLVADQTASTRLNLSVALTAFDPGIRVFEAATGREAQAILESGGIDIAFVSLQLPEITGAEVLALARIRGVQPISVLMSSQVMPRWVELSTELDAYEFLKKPFDPEHIVLMLTAIERMQAGSRLLLVDSNAAARQLVKRTLRASRFALDIEETDSGRHALKLLQLTSYDIAFVELALDGLDGLETACQARELSPETQVVLMSGAESATVAQTLSHFGITGFLKKPFYARDVDGMLHKAFGLRRPYLLNALATPAPRKKAGSR